MVLLLKRALPLGILLIGFLPHHAQGFFVPLTNLEATKPKLLTETQVSSRPNLSERLAEARSGFSKKLKDLATNFRVYETPGRVDFFNNENIQCENGKSISAGEPVATIYRRTYKIGKKQGLGFLYTACRVDIGEERLEIETDKPKWMGFADLLEGKFAFEPEEYGTWEYSFWASGLETFKFSSMKSDKSGDSRLYQVMSALSGPVLEFSEIKNEKGFFGTYQHHSFAASFRVGGSSATMEIDLDERIEIQRIKENQFATYFHDGEISMESKFVNTLASWSDRGGLGRYKQLMDLVTSHFPATETASVGNAETQVLVDQFNLIFNIVEKIEASESSQGDKRRVESFLRLFREGLENGQIDCKDNRSAL
jgi:hypothetical protein